MSRDEEQMLRSVQSDVPSIVLLLQWIVSDFTVKSSDPQWVWKNKVWSEAAEANRALKSLLALVNADAPE